MTANAKSMKPDRESGSMDGILPDESLEDFEKRVGDDIPEATEEDFARALPLSHFPQLAEALENARRKRGPQKMTVKDRIGLRLDHSVVEYFRASGPGWQSRINDILLDHIQRNT